MDIPIPEIDIPKVDPVPEGEGEVGQHYSPDEGSSQVTKDAEHAVKQE
jgi:hypothetical protein